MLKFGSIVDSLLTDTRKVSAGGKVILETSSNRLAVIDLEFESIESVVDEIASIEESSSVVEITETRFALVDDEMLAVIQFLSLLNNSLVLLSSWLELENRT